MCSMPPLSVTTSAHSTKVFVYDSICYITCNHVALMYVALTWCFGIHLIVIYHCEMVPPFLTCDVPWFGHLLTATSSIQRTVVECTVCWYCTMIAMWTHVEWAVKHVYMHTHCTQVYIRCRFEASSMWNMAPIAAAFPQCRACVCVCACVAHSHIVRLYCTACSLGVWLLQTCKWRTSLWHDLIREGHFIHSLNWTTVSNVTHVVYHELHMF